MWPCSARGLAFVSDFSMPNSYNTNYILQYKIVSSSQQEPHRGKQKKCMKYKKIVISLYGDRSVIFSSNQTSMSVRPTQVDPRFPLLVAAAVEPENSRAASSSQPLRSPMHFTCVLSQPKKQPKNQLDLLVLLVLFWLGLCSYLLLSLNFSVQNIRHEDRPAGPQFFEKVVSPLSLQYYYCYFL